ncbi:hypothetical protein PQG98_17350 [Bacteroides zhangwenhongii]|uniref:DUF4988 domain-containing protein n=1 Tax=Bacteroides zhangwenhongii TaxID=2650157 RepID=A0ABT5HC05_9BACE|nr:MULTISPECIES: hypothetical protein [Bacteroides]MDC7138094.1 hypothetical protein [Bacteroides zhangwenhongii]OKZ24688.1 MAG: hypothetical protein BHV74_03985 [Bacteroides finegoldii]
MEEQIMKRLMKWLLPCVCLVTLATGCSDSDGEGTPERQGKPITELTPDENKKELENIGMNLLSKINPDDHAVLLKTIARFDEIIPSPEIYSVLKSVGKVCADTDLSEMVSLASTRFAVVDMSYGTWEYNESTSQWDNKETGQKGEVTYKFKVDGTAATIHATYSDKTIRFEGRTVPVGVSMKVTLGTDTLAELNSSINMNEAETQISVNSSLSASGYLFGVVADINNNNSESMAVVTFSKDGEVLVSLAANGIFDSNLRFDPPLKSAAGELRIMDDLRVNLSCSDLQKIIEEDRKNDPTYEAYHKRMADVYNQYIHGELRYAESEYVVANIAFQAYAEDDNGDGIINDNDDWNIEPLIVFSQDGSKYSFDDYFSEVKFQSLLEQCEALVNKYVKLLK